MAGSTDVTRIVAPSGGGHGDLVVALLGARLHGHGRAVVHDDGDGGVGDAVAVLDVGQAGHDGDGIALAGDRADLDLALAPVGAGRAGGEEEHGGQPEKGGQGTDGLHRMGTSKENWAEVDSVTVVTRTVQVPGVGKDAP